MNANFGGESSSIEVAGYPNSGASATSSEPLMVSTGGQNYGLDVMDSDLTDLFLHQPNEPVPVTQAGLMFSSPPTAMAPVLGPSSELDSQCCLECCQMITGLENYIMADLKAFSLILGIIRRALQKASQLIEIQQSSSNLRFLSLFAAFMYQVLELLEVYVSAVTADKNRQRNRSLTGGTTGLGFGDFFTDAEEQSAIRNQTTLRETQRATEVLGKLKTLAGITPDAEPSSGAGSLQGKARGNCYHDLEARFRDFQYEWQRSHRGRASRLCFAGLRSKSL
ncbi:hypothetical protein GGR56DRAFT_146899 [Xylariaceae sp. FL0804]|nr:hypothetical protein GGR56DRAFT_146899 [Xylariaceae sp. FL0804]